MAYAGTILIADDERAFRDLTCRTVRKDGYDCCSARDAEEAIGLMRHNRFDLLLTDVHMPNDPDLRIVRKARELDDEMAIIVVTGDPSLETAIRSVELSVMAYLTKPLDWNKVRQRIRVAIEKSRKRRPLSSVFERLQSVLADLDRIRSRPLSDGETADTVSPATIRALASSLSELLCLAAQSDASWSTTNLCEILDCPQKPFHRQAIVETIDVIKDTKDAFKSKKLGQLRKKLEFAMEH